MSHHDPSSFKTPLAAAQSYLGLGWSIVPLAAGEKRPTAAWQKYQASLMNEDDIVACFGLPEPANIGVVCGAFSGVVVLDIDGAEGEASMAEFVLPRTPTVTTGNGRHLYFRHPGGRVTNRVRVIPGVDVRGDGGYVVAPPSLHPNGEVYRWTRGLSPTDIPLADAPSWSVACAGKTSLATLSASTESWADLVVDGVPEGKRNATSTSLMGHLLRHDVDPLVAVTMVVCWNRQMNNPPLPETEILEIADSVAGLEISRRESVY